MSFICCLLKSAKRVFPVIACLQSFQMHYLICILLAVSSLKLLDSEMPISPGLASSSLPFQSGILSHYPLIICISRVGLRIVAICVPWETIVDPLCFTLEICLQMICKYSFSISISNWLLGISTHMSHRHLELKMCPNLNSFPMFHCFPLHLP